MEILKIMATFDFVLLLTIFGSFLFLISFVIYNKDIIKGRSKPNVVSWSLFVIITGINSFSYLQMSGDIVKTILAFTDLFTCIVILVISIFKGNFKKIEKEEVYAIFLTGIAIILWSEFSATYGNLFLQTGYIMAFIPTFKNAYKQRETIFPWFLFAIAMFISLLVVIFRWNGQYQDLINPGLAFLLHLIVGIIAFKRNS